MSAMSALQQGKAAKAAAEFNANIARQNAQITREQTLQQVRQADREALLRTGAVTAAAGASGGKQQGSVLDVLGDVGAQNEIAAPGHHLSRRARGARLQNTATLDTLAVSKPSARRTCRPAASSCKGRRQCDDAQGQVEEDLMPKLPTFTADIGPVRAGPRARARTSPFPASTAPAARYRRSSASRCLSDAEEQESRKALVAELRDPRQVRPRARRGGDERRRHGKAEGADMQNEFSKVGENFQTRKGAQSLQLHASNTELMFDEQANRIRVHARRVGSAARGPQVPEQRERDDPVEPAVPEGCRAGRRRVRRDAQEHRAGEARRDRARAEAGAQHGGGRRVRAPGPGGHEEEARGRGVEPDARAARAGDAARRLRSARAPRRRGLPARRKKERQIREADDKARDKHFADIMGGTATRRAIMDDADLRPQTREHLIVFMEQRAKELTARRRSPTRSRCATCGCASTRRR
jgi:hypothetical protein